VAVTDQAGSWMTPAGTRDAGRPRSTVLGSKTEPGTHSSTPWVTINPATQCPPTSWISAKPPQALGARQDQQRVRSGLSARGRAHEPAPDHFRGEDFVRAVRIAQTKSGRKLQMLARLGPGPDHPVLLGHAEPFVEPVTVNHPVA